MNDKVKQLKEIVDNTDNLVFFGGAGVSTESGIPDFRSTDGLYHQHRSRFRGDNRRFRSGSRGDGQGCNQGARPS